MPASAPFAMVSEKSATTAPAFSPDKLPHIFERFYRAGSRSSRPGSGLGLAIAAEIASAHGGAAHAAPVSPHGLRITLTLPVRQAPGLRAEHALAASAG
jgi:signal transduction histidine kinase